MTRREIVVIVPSVSVVLSYKRKIGKELPDTVSATSKVHLDLTTLDQLKAGSIGEQFSSSKFPGELQYQRYMP